MEVTIGVSIIAASLLLTLITMKYIALPIARRLSEIQIAASRRFERDESIKELLLNKLLSEKKPLPEIEERS